MEDPSPNQVSRAACRVAAVDDHQVLLNGILYTISTSAPHITVVGAYRTLDDLVAGEPADVVLLDLNLTEADPDPIANIERVRRWGAQVLLFTALDDKPALVRKAIRAGAQGLALKADTDSDLIAAIESVAGGETAFSSRLAQLLVTDESLTAHMAPREIEVFDLLAAGLGRKQIGALLDPPISAGTVVEYLNRVTKRYRDLGRESHNVYDTLRHAVLDGHVELRDGRDAGTGR